MAVLQPGMTCDTGQADSGAVLRGAGHQRSNSLHQLEPGQERDQCAHRHPQRHGRLVSSPACYHTCLECLRDLVTQHHACALSVPLCWNSLILWSGVAPSSEALHACQEVLQACLTPCWPWQGSFAIPPELQSTSPFKEFCADFAFHAMQDVHDHVMPM